MELRTCYAIQNDKNLKMYIGVTKNINSRIKTHLNLLLHNKHKYKDLQDDFNKYGRDSFNIYILEDKLTWDRAFKVELDYIEKYKSYKPENGYNKLDKKSIGHKGFKLIEGLPKQNKNLKE